MAVYKYYVSDPVKYADAGLTGTTTSLGTDSDGAICYRTKGLTPALTALASLASGSVTLIGGATDATGYEIADDEYVVVPLESDVDLSTILAGGVKVGFVGWNGRKTRFDGGGTRAFDTGSATYFALSDAELYRCACEKLCIRNFAYILSGGTQGTATTRACSFTDAIGAYYVVSTHYDASFPSGYATLSRMGSSQYPCALNIYCPGVARIYGASDSVTANSALRIYCGSLLHMKTLHITEFECEGDVAVDLNATKGSETASADAHLAVYGSARVGGNMTGGGMTTKDGATEATVGGNVSACSDMQLSSSCGLTVGGDVECTSISSSSSWLKCRDLTASGNVKLATLNARDVTVDSDHSTQVTTLTARYVSAGNYAKGTSWSVASLYVNGNTIATTRTSASAVTSLSFAGPTPLPYGDVTRVWQSGGTYTTDMDGTTSAATPGSSDVVYFGTDGIDLGSASFTCAKCYVAANCSVDVAGITCNEVVLEDGAEITGYGSLTWIGHTITSSGVLEKFHLEAPAFFTVKNCNISD